MFVRPRQSGNDHHRRTRSTAPLSNNTPDIKVNTDTNTNTNTGSASSSSSSSSSSSRHQRQWLPMVLIGSLSAAVTAWAALALVSFSTAKAQPDKYMTGGDWKTFFTQGKRRDTTWWIGWNSMIQPRIDELAALVESDREKSHSGPFRVTMVGDSTMMQQHGAVCSFLGERPGRRFDPSKHQEECCIDTPPQRSQSSKKAALDIHTETNLGNSEMGTEEEGGRGLCFRHHDKHFLDDPEWESLGSPDAVYFGCGLHLMHMSRPGLGLYRESVKGWLTYERDLENVVKTYREEGGNGFRLIFMTTHLIQESVYEGEFLRVVQGYRDNDTEVISSCQNQVFQLAEGTTGQEGYGVDAYCRQGLMARNGSEIINKRARPVMARLGVPLVEADLIVKDQAWATVRQDGRHYAMLLPVEIWELLDVLVSTFKTKPTPATE
ncbi:unnamed protein product [Pylaiella littoralis]